MAKTRMCRRGSSPAGGAKDVDEYLAGIEEPARRALERIRAAIRSMVPATATETISYGMPAFRYKGILVWYAAFSKHCSFFPTAAVVEAFAQELKSFSVSKGTIRFSPERPIPLTLIRRMVKARVAQNDAKPK